MKKLILHIGSPKSATTLVQGFMQQNTSVYSGDYSVKFVTPRDLRRSDLIKYFTPELFCEADYAGDSEEVDSARRFLEELLDVPEDVVFLSEETLSHELMPRRKTGRGFSTIHKTVSLLKKYFSECLDSVEVVLTIRKQASFLQSCYLHKVYRSGWNMDFSKYLLDHVNPMDLNWYSVAKAIGAEFGVCKVLPFEILFSGEETFLKEFSRRLVGVDVSQNEDVSYSIPEIYKNESVSNKALDMMKRCNSAFSDPARRESFSGKFIEEFPASKFGKPVLMSSDWREFLDSHYIESNRAALSEFSGLSEDEIEKFV